MTLLAMSKNVCLIFSHCRTISLLYQILITTFDTYYHGPQKLKKPRSSDEELQNGRFLRSTIDRSGSETRYRNTNEEDSGGVRQKPDRRTQTAIRST